MNIDIQPIQRSMDHIINHSEHRLYPVNLDYLSLIKVEGIDAPAFLQGQFSNDLEQIQPCHGQLNAYCTPKGRALAIFQLFKDSEAACYWILIPKDISASFMKRLQMFVMRAKVTLAALPDHQFSGLLGSAAINPDQHQRCFSVNGIYPRYLLIDNSAPSSDSDASHPDLTGEYWKLVDIESGIPQVYSQTSEVFIPQNVNMDLVDGVSFRKGCYPGQEIVARLKYLGKSKQRMGLARISDADQVEPGMSIFSDERPDQKSGVVVDAVKTADSEFLISAMLPARPLITAKFYLGSVEGAALELLPLPYDIPED